MSIRITCELMPFGNRHDARWLANIDVSTMEGEQPTHCYTISWVNSAGRILTISGERRKKASGHQNIFNLVGDILKAEQGRIASLGKDYIKRGGL